jgi:hypothetical protein
MNMTDEQKQTLANIAYRCLGIKYTYGAKVNDLAIEPEKITTIDCSGLTKYLLNKVNISIPDGAINQYAKSEPAVVPETGFLAFKSQNGMIDHVGLIIAQPGLPVCVLEASGSLGQVVLRDLGSFKTFPHGVDFAGVRKLIIP